MTRRKSQQGSTLLESALTMLIFFGIVFLFVEAGCALSVYKAIDAAREGARYAVAPYASGTLPSDVSAWMHRTTWTACISAPRR